MTDTQTDRTLRRQRQREKEGERVRQGFKRTSEKKEGNRRRDSVEQEESGRRERNSDTPLRETEGVIK